MFTLQRVLPSETRSDVSNLKCISDSSISPALRVKSNLKFIVDLNNWAFNCRSTQRYISISHNIISLKRNKNSLFILNHSRQTQNKLIDSLAYKDLSCFAFAFCLVTQTCIQETSVFAGVLLRFILVSRKCNNIAYMCEIERRKTFFFLLAKVEYSTLGVSIPVFFVLFNFHCFLVFQILLFVSLLPIVFT